MGCRKYKGEAFYDDLTGQTHLPEELEEIAFIFDGKALVIHLDDENAASFREAMAPYMEAAQETSKARVLRTLPARRRHLRAVPAEPVSSETEDVPQHEPQREDSTPEGRFPYKGESVEARTTSEGPRVPETPFDASDSCSPETAPRPSLSVVPPPAETEDEQWKPWAPMAPRRGESKQDQVRKTRKWATQMGTPEHTLITPDIIKEWEKFYRDKEWQNIQ